MWLQAVKSLHHNSGANVKKSQKEKIYLHVPYEEKDKAKKLGAKWDASRKKWYIFSDHEHVDILQNHWC